jgi:hypothetical protein
VACVSSVWLIPAGHLSAPWAKLLRMFAPFSTAWGLLRQPVTPCLCSPRDQDREPVGRKALCVSTRMRVTTQKLASTTRFDSHTNKIPPSVVNVPCAETLSHGPAGMKIVQAESVSPVWCREQTGSVVDEEVAGRGNSLGRPGSLMSPPGRHLVSVFRLADRFQRTSG